MEEENEERETADITNNPVPMSTEGNERETVNNRTSSQRSINEIIRRFDTFESFDEQFSDGKIYDIIHNADDAIQSMVLSYMVHYGYKKSALAFVKQVRESRPQDFVFSLDNQSQSIPQDNNLLYFNSTHNNNSYNNNNNNNNNNDSTDSSFGFIDERKKIMDLISKNNPTNAIECINHNFPELFPQYPQIEFYLNALVFIDLVATGKKMEALDFARSNLVSIVKNLKNNNENNINENNNENNNNNNYNNINSNEIYSELNNELKDISMLLCFPDRDAVPADSPVAHFFSDDYRAVVAESVNAAILEMQKQPQNAPLEKLLQQLTMARDRLYMESGQRGTRWRLSDFLTVNDMSQNQ